MASIKDDRGYNQGFKPSPALEIRTRRRADYIIGKLGAEKGDKILEIGCGTGEMSFLLAKKSQAEVIGTDICESFITQAKKEHQLGNLSFEVMDFNNQKLLEGRKFDFIVGNGILHHLYKNLDLALLSIRRLLKPGGRIVFLEPNILNPYCFLVFNFNSFRRLANLEPEEMAFTKGFIIRKLKAAGFSGILVEHRDFLLPNTPKQLINPLIRLGGLAEKLPLVRLSSQSIFISARRS
jgi:2-polyprenyl-3-methyl-5-hydroxy-6-metoxy-1,4-benzoquinol methylase